MRFGCTYGYYNCRALKESAIAHEDFMSAFTCPSKSCVDFERMFCHETEGVVHSARMLLLTGLFNWHP